MDRRSKYQKQIVKNQDLKIDVNFDITQLDMLCNYVVCSNRHIRRGNIINLRNLLALIDMNNYNGDQERLNRIDFIERGIEARLQYNLIDQDMIIQQIVGGFGMGKQQYLFHELSTNEVQWIETMISETLKYHIIYNDIDKGLSLLTKFKSTDFASRGRIVSDIEKWVIDIHSKFRKAKMDTYEEMRFSMIGEDYKNSLLETYKKLASPSNRLIFGTQALNAITGGGVESGRVYVLLGLPGEGKSTTMLDMAIQIKRYNTHYICKDPTKKPCVVLLTMENTVKETIQRLFSMCVGNDMLNYSEQEVLDILKNQGNFKVTDDDPISLFVYYKPNLSVDTSYLYELVEDLEDEGFECICMIQDYLKRIRSVDGLFGGDLRLQLGAIINEERVFCALKDIPLITASQLNREATNIIDNARINNKADLVRLIGRGNVGESNLILENADWIGLLAPEYDSNGIRHLGLQRVKSRYYIPGDFFCAYMPYANNTIKLIEDYQSPVPAHKVTLKEQVMLNMGPGNGMVNEIKEFTEFNGTKLQSDSENNMFLNAAAMVARNVALMQIANGYKVMAHKVSR